MATPTKTTSSRKGSTRSTSSRRDATARRPSPRPFTVDHFRRYAGLLVFDDGELREPEDWQLDVARDIFDNGFTETWLIVPEGNGKTTFVAELALYGADYSESPWIPVGASARDQARIMYTQAKGFVKRTPGLEKRFRCFDGYRRITSLRNGGEGIQIYAADPKTGDGVIPFPFAIIDELHRHDDLRLYRLWKGKLRKRGGQILTISTAGEPESEFENARESIRRLATDRQTDGAYTRAQGPGLVLHEHMVVSDDACTDMAAVKAANPLSSITERMLADDFSSPTTELADWKRFKCNRPTRGVSAAITDSEWDGAEADEKEIPAGERVDVGFDVAWKWDTTAFVPLWKGPDYRLLGEATILVPPRDGTTLHPDRIKAAFTDLRERTPIGDVVMDLEDAEDIASWLEDELGVRVIDRGQTNQFAVMDFNNFMEGLRNGTLKHTGGPGLRSHVLHAIARRLPGGDWRFDRPSTSRSASKQDMRVIDALTAAGMVNTHTSVAPEPPKRSRALVAH